MFTLYRLCETSTYIFFRIDGWQHCINFQWQWLRSRNITIYHYNSIDCSCCFEWIKLNCTRNLFQWYCHFWAPSMKKMNTFFYFRNSSSIFSAFTFHISIRNRVHKIHPFISDILLRSVFPISWYIPYHNFNKIYLPFFFLKHIIQYSSTKQTTHRKHFFSVLHIKNKSTCSNGMFDTSRSAITLSHFQSTDNLLLWVLCFSTNPAQKHIELIFGNLHTTP